MTFNGRGLRTPGLALAFAFAFAGGCYSQPAPAAAPVAEPCAGSPDEATLLNCHQAEFEKAEAAVGALVGRLNRYWSADEPNKAEALARAQAAWARSREADCVVDTWDSRGGTAFEVYRLDCVTKAAKGRAAYLKALTEAP